MNAQPTGRRSAGRRVRTAAVAAMLAAALAVAPATAQEGKDAGRRILRVGPDRELKTPSAAARIAAARDIVEIDPGTYRDCAIWLPDELVLRARDMARKPHLTGVVCEDRGIWVIKGRSTTVQGIEFSHAHSSRNNGAGILHDGVHMIVRDSAFHDNENGVLIANRSDSQVWVADSRFERNGKCEPECAHGIYAGRIRMLRLHGSTFVDQRAGHHVKSRAGYTEIIGCQIMDGPAGTASYEIDLPNGGTALIRQNTLEKGPRADNHTAIISIGAEGAFLPGNGYRIEGNTFRNNHPTATIFVRNASPQPAQLRANAFFGNGRPLAGAGAVEK